MKRKIGKRCFSMLLAAAVTLSGFSFPVSPVSTVTAAVKQDDMREVNFNMDWKFKLGNVSGAEQKNYDDTSWEDITIPHDFSITREFSNSYEAESGFLPGGTGWYRKTAVLPAAYAGKSIILNFDGIYNHAYVYVNGTKVGEHHYGYTDFSFDVTGLLICDGKTENVIAVKAVNEFPSSRWYSGSGIYRDVTLMVTDSVHVALNGTYVTTPNLETQKNGNVTVNVETTVQNDSSSAVSAEVRTTVLDADDKAVSSVVSKTASIAAGAAAELTFQPTVSRPELWSCDNPALYYVKTEVLVGGTLKDTYMTEFGFRYFNFNANTGFSLNGEKMKIKGVCMHHDQGALGSAAYYDAMYRQMRILKDMGCNAIRTSHNPASKELISICNELGMLVQEEFFDGWSAAKNGNYNDFSVYFNSRMTSDNQIIGASTSKTWAQFTMESTICRDRNAPSIIMWSLGNELSTGTSAVSGFETIAGNLISWAKACDDTRPLTVGDNTGSFSDSYFYTNIDRQIYESGGVVGLNYHAGSYATQHAAKPNWPLIASETASPHNSRGIYSTTSKIAGSGNYQCTAYDTLSASWGNVTRAAWYPIITNDFMAGEFIWTGFDYIGEPTPWNGTGGSGSVSGDSKAIPNSSFFGVIDTAGFPKDSYYFYTSQWKEDATTLHIVPGTWNEGELTVSNGYVPVYIYSNAAKVELFLNNTKIGTSTRVSHSTSAGFEYGTYTNTSNSSSVCSAVSASGYDSMSAQFKVKYTEGTLSAKAYDASGRLISETVGISSVKTNSDSGASLKLTPEKTELQADGSSLCYISVDVLDGNENFVAGADNNIRFTLTGNGTIVGVDNGNPSTLDKFQQKSVLTSSTNANIKAFSGKALVIVRSTETAGGFTLRAEADGLTGRSVNVATVGDGATSVYLNDYELETNYSVEMGTAPVLQTQVQGTMSDGTTVSGNVAWDTITEDIYNNPGDYRITGVLTIAEQEIAVVASLHVKAQIAAMLNYSAAALAGRVPVLPAVLPGVLPDGQIYNGNYPVNWDSVTAEEFNTPGDIVTVNGTATAEDGAAMPVTASIRVAEGEESEPVNAARECKTLTESCGTPSDNLQSIIDGITNDFNGTDARWTNYNDRLLNSDATITFTWDEVKKLDNVKLYFFTDSFMSALPAEVQFAVSENGTDYKTVEATGPDSISSVSTYTFGSTQNAKGLRVTLTEQTGHCVGLVECEIYTAGYSYDMYSTALLDTLTVNGLPAEGFVSGQHNSQGYNVSVANAADAAVAATALDNASVTILPVDGDDIVRVLVQSEDKSAVSTYAVKLTNSTEKADQALLSSLSEEINRAKSRSAADYTKASWQALADAVQEAETLSGNSNALKYEVENMITRLRTLQNTLVEAPDAQLLARLETAISDAEAKRAESDKYTSASFKTFTDALTAAAGVKNSQDPAKTEVDNAITNLQTAQAGLVEAPTASLLAEFAQAITDAEGKKAEDYTETSYRNLQTALNAAKAVSVATASKAEVENALSALQDALEELEEVSGPEMPDQELLEQFDSAIAEAAGKEEGKYTSETWALFKAALEEAERVKGTATATKAQVEQALLALQNALEGLEEVSGPEMPDQELLEQFDSAIAEAAGKEEGKYTSETWEPFKAALEEAERVKETAAATKAQVEQALLALQNAQAALKEKEEITGPDAELAAQLTNAVKEAEGKDEKLYTAESYKELAEALAAAKAVQSGDKATNEEVKQALDRLQAALGRLQKKPDNTDDKPVDNGGTALLPAVGSIHVYGKSQYKVTKSAAVGGTVTYMKPTKKTLRKVKVPAAIKIQNITFKVTAIAPGALKNNKKLTKVTVGKNVEKIGKAAFSGDRRLKSIVVKSSYLKSVGKKALKGVHAECRIKVPKKKLKKYKALFRKKGQKSSVKVVK